MTSPVSAIEAIERFERAVRANGYRTSDDQTEAECQAAKAVVLAFARKAEAYEREIAELREALKPFAECCPEWDGEPDSLHVFFEWNDECAPVPSLPVADFRRARAALQSSETTGEKP
jgi:hypothetical protein